MRKVKQGRVMQKFRWYDMHEEVLRKLTGAYLHPRKSILRRKFRVSMTQGWLFTFGGKGQLCKQPTYVLEPKSQGEKPPWDSSSSLSLNKARDLLGNYGMG